MTEPSRRIVVDGVDFAQLVRFPRILNAAAGAFQPGRLVVALFVIAALLTGGRIWDGLAEPTIHPAGLGSGPWSQGERVAARERLVEALGEFNAAALADRDGDAAALDALWANRGAAARGLVLDGARRATGLAAAAKRDRLAATLRSLERRRPRGSFEAVLDQVSASFDQVARGVLRLDVAEVRVGMAQLFAHVPRNAWREAPWFTVLYGLFALVVLAVGGGALCRMTACRAAGDERLGVAEAFDFALRHWRRLVAAPIVPLVVAAILAAFTAGLGWIAMLPWVDVLGGVLYGLALVLGFGVAFLLIGYAFGFVMLLPAAVCEDADAADAHQRAYAYAIGRPLHLVGYGLTALVGLAIGYLVVSVFAVVLLNLTAALVGAFSGNPALDVAGGATLFDLGPSAAEVPPDALHERIAAGAILFWRTVVACLVAGYVLSYLAAAGTWIYLLMRQTCDGQAVEEIWREDELFELDAATTPGGSADADG